MSLEIAGHIAQTRSGSGQTDNQVAYTAFSPPGGPNVVLEEYRGLLPGEYKVSFSRFLMPDGSPYDARNATDSSMTADAVETIPFQFVDPHRSSYQIVLSFESSETFDFDINTKSK